MLKRILSGKSKILIVYLISALLYLPVIDTHSSILVAMNSQSCDSNLDQAEEHYYNGEFEKTIDLVKQCLLDSSLTQENKIRAYTILTRTFLAKNDAATAKKTAQKILEFDPAYQPTIEQETPGYVDLVTEVRKEQAQSKLEQAKSESGLSEWYYYGAGAAVIVATVFLLVKPSSGGGDKPGTPLPTPPDFPQD